MVIPQWSTAQVGSYFLGLAMGKDTPSSDTPKWKRKKGPILGWMTIHKRRSPMTGILMHFAFLRCLVKVGVLVLQYPLDWRHPKIITLGHHFFCRSKPPRWPLANILVNGFMLDLGWQSNHGNSASPFVWESGWNVTPDHWWLRHAWTLEGPPKCSWGDTISFQRLGTRLKAAGDMVTWEGP